MAIDILFQLYQRSNTVFTIAELAQLFPGLSVKALKNRLYYYSKSGKLLRLHQGIYAKKQYEPLELANKLYKPSYVSLETVLAKAGIIFQYYETVFLTAYITRRVEIQGLTFQYRRLKPELLLNSQGVNNEQGFFMASPERAFLDAVYIYKDYHFDNLAGLNWEKIKNLKSIYKNKAFYQRLDQYYKLYKENNAKS